MQKLIVELQGGLGNQLFQFANAYRIKNSLAIEHEIILSEYLLRKQSADSRFTPREFSLQRLHINSKPSLLDRSLIRLVDHTNGQLFPGSKRFQSSPKFPLRIREDSYRRTEANIANSNLVILSGFWQDFRYYMNYRFALADIIDSTTNQHYSQNFKLLYSEIINSNSMIIHFRRGDYLLNPRARNFHGLLGDSYFQNAFNINLNIGGKNKVFIFTEDQRFLGNTFDFIPSNVKTVVDESFRLSSWEILLLMRISQSIVLSNSSLSWWAAFSQSEPTKQKVYGPSRWFLQEDKTLMLPDWEKIDPAFMNFGK